MIVNVAWRNPESQAAVARLDQPQDISIPGLPGACKRAAEDHSAARPVKDSRPIHRVLCRWLHVLATAIFLAVGALGLRAADSVVVLNEIHYHPATNESALEWIELRNQMAVDVDLSAWRLRDGVEYTVPEGTFIPGGGYVVVALNPAALQAATGLTNVLGPFAGRLSNAGEKVELRDRNGRLMDVLSYGVEGDWPVAPDGAGPSLAKRDEDTPSDGAARWRASAPIGGTPGVCNNPDPATAPPMESLPLAFNEISSVTNAQFWVEIVNRGTQSVTLANCVLARFGTTNREAVLPPQLISPGDYIVLDRAALGFGADPGDRVILYAPGKTSVLDAVVAKSFSRARWPEGGGPWLHPHQPSPGGANCFAFHEEIVINEIMYHHAPQLEIPLDVSPGALRTNQIIGLTNSWHYNQSGDDLGTDWRLPGYNDQAWPAGRALLYVSTATLQGPKNTPLTLGPTTYYFRTTFLHTSGPPAFLVLRHIVDDGAVFYLNGVELTRYRMPLGTISHNDRASAGIGIPTFAMTNVSTANLVAGTNVLAVEVHQALNSGNDIVFGAELSVVAESVPAVPYQESGEEWIELFNRGTNAATLAGWKLGGGIDFHFASNTVIARAGYLVVARDPAVLQAQYPGLSVVGPYTNRLSHRNERIMLEDAAGNPADEVCYVDGGRWPAEADGHGSSLELRNPFADNSVPEAWAPSDEGRKSSWRTYTYRGIAAPSAVGPDGQWREFVIGLLDAGDILLDDIRVIESPDTSPTSLLQNGTFDTGTNHWRIIGNHHGEIIPDPDQPGNQVLRLVATGATEHMSNHGETTLANNADVVNGRAYEISFRAKWIRGSRQFLTRLYLNRLAKTTILDEPQLAGTPGARNSTYAPNLGPTYADFRHDPPVPAPLALVTVSVLAGDPDGINSILLWWRPDGGQWTSVPMAEYATRNPLHAFTAAIPGHPAGTVIQFYIQGTDALGADSSFPAAGPNSHALFQVDDGRAATNGLHNVRLIMLANDAGVLLHPLNAMSEDREGCTVISDEREVFYDAGVRLKGSEHSRTSSERLGFNLAFPSDHLYRGIHQTVALDRSQGGGFGQREMLVHQTFNHAGGVPTKYHDLGHIITPRPEHAGPAEMQLARYSNVFLDDQFSNGGDGALFEYEIIYQLGSTDTGTPEGNKVPQSDGWVGTTIRDLGNDKENYRWTFLVKNNEARDDYSRIIRFAKAMGLSGADFTRAITNLIDVDQYLRSLAVAVLSGSTDNYGAVGDVHNGQFYVRPGDNRVLFFPHDLDLGANATAPITHGDVSKLIAFPAHARAYYRHLRDMIATTCNSAYMAHWTENFGRLLPDQDFPSYLPFFDARASYVLSRINQAAPFVAFAITSNNGGNFQSSSNLLTLEGNGWLDVAAIEVNGIPCAIQWIGTTRWSITISLAGGANRLAIQAVDGSGGRPANLADLITVTNIGPSALLPVVINEWMADSAAPGGFPDPADGLFQDWFELFNPNAVAVSLSGCHLTDDLASPTKWTIPTNTIIAPRGFLLVWADENAAQNGSGTNGDLHANFKLSAGGEALGLFAPDSVTPWHTVVFGAQFQNVSQGLFPDGATNAVYSMTNWTPRAANTLTPPNRPRLLSLERMGSLITLQCEVLPGRTYQLQFKNDLDAPAWTPAPLAAALQAAGNRLSIADLLDSSLSSRFYRVVLLP